MMQSDNQRKLAETVIISSTSKVNGKGVEIGTMVKMAPTELTVGLGGEGTLDELYIQPEEIEEFKKEGIISADINLEELSKLNIEKQESIAYEIKIRRAEKKLPRVEIKSVQYKLIPNDLYNKISVVEINNAQDKGPGSINDPKLGISKGVDICYTCKRRSINCPSHLGKIKLVEPIYHPLYIRNIIKILQCVCPKCGRLVISPELLSESFGIDLSIPAEIRLSLIEAECKKVSENGYKHGDPINTEQEECCPSDIEVGPITGCYPNNIYIISPPNYKKTGRIEYTSGVKSDKKSRENQREMLPEDALKIFQLLEKNPRDLELLGLIDTKPSDLILQNIFVLSPIKRGAALMETGINSDRLGTIYKHIIQDNIKLANSKQGAIVKRKYIGTSGKREMTVEELKINLFKSVSALYKSEDKSEMIGSTTQSSIIDEMTGKKGIFRGQLMSARINFSARTVIGPNPSLEFGQVSVPKIWGPYLTVPVDVANFNIAVLTKLVRSGKVTNVIKGKAEGYSIHINDKNKDNIDIEIGDRVERWLQDGDYITVNRQPTLHRQSTVAMRVKLVDSLSMGLHLSSTTGFNADFDGDEMNTHVGQTIEVMAELSEIMRAELCIANEQNSAPIVGLVMDNILAAYLLTSEDEIMSPQLWNDCILAINTRDDLGTFDDRRREEGVAKYSGRALFSTLLPKGFYYNRGGVLIVNGILKHGTIKKDHIGTVANSIIQELYMDPYYGIPRASKFLTDAPRMLNRWLASRGFSIGIKDCIPPPQIAQLVKEEVAKARMIIQQMDEVIDNPIEDNKRESEIILTLNKVREKIGSELSKMPELKNNAFYVMISSKSKGSLLNLVQVLGIVGQQTAWGGRTPKTLSGGTRSLPHFDETDETIESRGFIKNSYAEGLTNTEYFMHALASRESIINTALDTPQVGNLRRNLIKLLEDLHVAYDGSVRDGKGKIIQYIYGDDGFVASGLRRVNIRGQEVFLPVDFQALADKLNIKYSGGM